MEIQARLAEFYRRLAAAPAAASADEAIRLVCRLIEQVEDEFCPLPRQEPPPWNFTGRMYAPQPDRIKRSPQGQLVADTRHHRIYCEADGGIEIVRMPEHTTEMSKPGKTS